MIYEFLADGFEEIEALTPVDFFRRCGIKICTVGVGGKVIRGSHGISVVCDMEAGKKDLTKDVEGVILPGGMPGTKNLQADGTVKDALMYCAANGKYICAICAAPTVLGYYGLLKGKKATCFPGMEAGLTGAEYVDESVVTDGLIITAKGMGVSLAFAFEAASLIAGKEKAKEVLRSVQYRDMPCE